MIQKLPSKTPVILDIVASLTTIRDLDIFEFSFIKTLAEMLKVDDISMYKITNQNEHCRLIKYSPKATVEGAEPESIQVETVEVPTDIKLARDNIKLAGDIYTLQKGDDFVTVYPVSGLQGIVGYLSISLNHQLSDSENLVVSSLLSISQNFHTLLEENQKDKLTGLLNRKTFDDSIAKIQNILNSTPENIYLGDEKREGNNGSDYWLSIIDIDHFKKINDTFGHIYGDEVLLMLSQVMKKTFRPKDLLFRFGGEEFIVIIKVANKQEAELAFERFRVAIEEFRFPQVGQVTISLGATLIQQQHAIASDIVGRADEALYYAKEQGRNKLFFYEDLLSSGVFKEKNEAGDVELF